MLTTDDKNEIKDIMVDVLKETVMPIIENMNETLADHSQKFIEINNRLDKHQEMIYTLIGDVDDIKTEMIMGNELRKTIKGNLKIQAKQHRHSRIVIERQ